MARATRWTRWSSAPRALALAAAASLAVAAAACGGGSAGGGRAVTSRSYSRLDGPSVRVTYVGAPRQRIRDLGPSRDSVTGYGVTMHVRLDLSQRAHLEYYVVAPSEYVLRLERYPPRPANDTVLDAGAHAFDLAPGPWGAMQSNPCRREPCTLVVLASRGDVLGVSPWETPPRAPGFYSPDSLFSFVADEVFRDAPRSSWGGAYHRLPPGLRW